MSSRSRCLSAIGLSAVILVTVAKSPGQTLAWSGTPALGQTIVFTVTGTPNQNYLLAVSNLPGPTPLPPLGTLAIGQPFYILVGPNSPFPFYPALGANGEATVSIQIPLNLAFFGQTYWFQAAYTDPQAPLFIALTNGTSFTIGSPLSAPVIASIQPASGGASGGTPVTITGDHFLPGPTTATLGGQPLGNLQVVDAQTITGTTPAGAPGTGANLAVSAAGGSAALAGAFSYLPELPAILSIVPDHVPAGGGTLITINGTGLGPGTTVYLGGLPLQPMTQTAGQIMAFAPLITTVGYVDAAVVSPLGINFHYDVFRYTVHLDTGTGADGVYAPSANTTLSTANNFGVWNFASVNIPAGVTVTVTGPNPLTMKCTGSVTIAGTLDLAGTNGPAPNGGPGGFTGGVPPSGAGSGPGAGGLNANCNLGYCASHGTHQPGCALSNGSVIYGTYFISPLVGGSGGRAGSGGSEFGGGGGGAIAIIAVESIAVSGLLNCRGGNQQFNAGSGSGGSVRIQGLRHVTVSGQISVAGGSNCSGHGRWYVQNWLGQAAYDTTPTVPTGIY